MIQTILLPLDGSVWAEAALPHAVALASRLGARLLLVRAVGVRTLPGRDAWTARLRATAVAHAYLARVTAAVRAMSPTLSVGVAIPAGSPCEAILDEATLEHAGLIVMTSHGATGPTPHGVGRVAAGVMANTEVPVLLVRPAAPAGEASPARLARPDLADMPWLRQRVHVLVVMDGTPAAEDALAFVARLGAFVTLSVTLLHVLRPTADGSTASQLNGLAGRQGRPRPALRLSPPHGPRPEWAMAAYCHRAAAWLGTQGVAARVEFRCGDVVVELIHAAQEGKDVIVYGAHAPQTALRWGGDFLVDRIARAAPVPVVVVPSCRTDYLIPLETNEVAYVAASSTRVCAERAAPQLAPAR
jgi:nucleotide-binding universal stress UspA family protein